MNPTDAELVDGQLNKGQTANTHLIPGDYAKMAMFPVNGTCFETNKPRIASTARVAHKLLVIIRTAVSYVHFSYVNIFSIIN